MYIYIYVYIYIHISTSKPFNDVLDKQIIVIKK